MPGDGATMTESGDGAATTEPRDGAVCGKSAAATKSESPDASAGRLTVGSLRGAGIGATAASLGSRSRRETRPVSLLGGRAVVLVASFGLGEAPFAGAF